ncbi:stearoyl-CoA 9-desaturase [Streptomyces phyllanthi]|uniref:Stearoyl-CoA 9-desaturase n=1 Tax=Streptomyces phyllanthi TaxID=1803180 RepID=A0A5N8W2R9_9ACTN|nr:fatty acid desaturase [Streptomyces phyllanthi]MPY41790.1 stearoyl-CoA 9-desaturase [Streptomyces phyllanthi]
MAGVAMGWAGVSAGGWWLLVLPVSWLLTVHGMRKLGSMILHQCTHSTYASGKRANRILGEFISVLLITQEYDDYSREHVSDHHSVSHMTIDDPTARFIVEVMGCRPGMARNLMWRSLVRTLLSPIFHLRATYERLRSHFSGTSGRHRLLTAVTLAAQALAVTAAHAWTIALVVWVVPLTVLYNAAGVLRLSCRHLFPAAGQDLDGRTAIAAATHGIFLGERTPDPALRGMRRAWSWTGWWLRMILNHLVTRLFVMVGDGPCHDYHHRFPKSRNWVNYPFARRDDIAGGHPSWPAYTEVWGLRAAINEVFDSLYRADPAAYELPPAVRRSSGARAVRLAD